MTASARGLGICAFFATGTHTCSSGPSTAIWLGSLFWSTGFSCRRKTCGAGRTPCAGRHSKSSWLASSNGVGGCTCARAAPAHTVLRPAAAKASAVAVIADDDVLDVIAGSLDADRAARGSVTSAHRNRHAASDRLQDSADHGDGTRPHMGRRRGRHRGAGDETAAKTARSSEASGWSECCKCRREGGNTMKLTHISFVIGTILPLLTACEPGSTATHHTTTAALKNGNGAPPVEDVPADSPSGANTRPNPFGPQHFAGAVLDQARAEAIAAGAGFDLVAFYRCAPDSVECAMFEVQGPRNVFMYEVSATPCRRTVIFEQGYQATIGTARAARSSTSRSAEGNAGDGTA